MPAWPQINLFAGQEASTSISTPVSISHTPVPFRLGSLPLPTPGPSDSGAGGFGGRNEPDSTGTVSGQPTVLVVETLRLASKTIGSGLGAVRQVVFRANTQGSSKPGPDTPYGVDKESMSHA